MDWVEQSAIFSRRKGRPKTGWLLKARSRLRLPSFGVLGPGPPAGEPDGACWSVMGEAEFEDAQGPSVYSKMVAGPAFLRCSSRERELQRHTEQIASWEITLAPHYVVFRHLLA